MLLRCKKRLLVVLGPSCTHVLECRWTEGVYVVLDHMLAANAVRQAQELCHPVQCHLDRLATDEAPSVLLSVGSVGGVFTHVNRNTVHAVDITSAQCLSFGKYTKVTFGIL